MSSISRHILRSALPMVFLLWTPILHANTSTTQDNVQSDKIRSTSWTAGIQYSQLDGKMILSSPVPNYGFTDETKKPYQMMGPQISYDFRNQQLVGFRVDGAYLKKLNSDNGLMDFPMELAKIQGDLVIKHLTQFQPFIGLSTTVFSNPNQLTNQYGPGLGYQLGAKSKISNFGMEIGYSYSKFGSIVQKPNTGETLADIDLELKGFFAKFGVLF